MIDEIHDKEKTMLEELTQRRSRGFEVEKVGDEKIAIWDQEKEGYAPSRGRSFNRLLRSRSRIRQHQETETPRSLEHGIERTSSFLSWNGVTDGAAMEKRKEDAKARELDSSAPSRGRSFNRLLRSRSRTRQKPEREPSLKPWIETTGSFAATYRTTTEAGEADAKAHMPEGSATSRGRSITRLLRSRSGSRRNPDREPSLEYGTAKANSFLNFRGAPNGTKTEARKDDVKIQEPETTDVPRRRSFTNLLRSRSRTHRNKKRAVVSGETELKLRKEDITDIHSALKEMEKQLKVAKKNGNAISRETIMDALRCVVESLDPIPKENEYRIKVESTADAASVGEATTDDCSRYTHGSHTSDGNSQFTADYTHDSNDTRSYVREHDATSFFTEFSEGDGTTYGGTSDGSEADDGSFDDETSWDDATHADSVGSSYLSGEGFRIGQTDFVIKTPTFKDVFPMWGTSSGPPEVKEVTKPQTSMFQNVTRATSLGAKSEALPVARSESSLEMIQANVKKLSEQVAADKGPKSIAATQSFASASEIYATDQFRALSPLGSPPRPQQLETISASQSCNAVPADLTSWLKVDDTDLKSLWDDLFWRTSRNEEEPRALTPPPRPPRFASSRNLSQDSIDEIVIAKQRSDVWPEATPTEASSSPSEGNSPERQPMSVAGQRGEKKANSWFRRRKAEARPEARSRLVICSYADSCSPLESPFANINEIKPSAGDYIRAVTNASQRYIFDDDDDDDDDMIGVR